MSNDEKKTKVVPLLIEPEGDGYAVHGPTCARTKAAFEALERDGTIDKRGQPACTGAGPGQVATKAYRDGYDAINWGGKPTVVGQA